MRCCLRFGLLATIVGLFSLLPMYCWAEFRTWTAASGGYRTEAEFVELRDGKVHLRLKAGGERDVPLEKLSAVDQAYVRSQNGKTATIASNASGDSRLAELERRAARCQSAEEALRLYRLFRDDPQTTDDQRRAILPAFEKLRELADKKMVRLKGQWVSESEFKSVRAQANTLMKLGLELLRLKQDDGFRKKFAEAAALEPDSIRADFIMGMIYTMHTNDLVKTKQYFDACLKRDPDNVCVLNNLAITSVKRDDWTGAVNFWRKAISLEPNQGIVQNLGRFLHLSGRKRIEAPKSSTAKITEMYATLIATGKYEPTDAKRGWMYMLIDGESLSLTSRDPEKEKQEAAATAAPPPGEDGSMVVGGGTGFVVFPQYILTNNHVVAGGSSVEIQTSGSTSKQTLPAKVIATSEKPDLALVYCEGLDAPALPIDTQLARRGTEILALGYPKMFDLGASLKATRGIISAVPSSAQEDMYLYDATVNPGNSGGPVFDNHGNVIAVTTVLWRFESQYGGGLPSSVAMEFIKKHLPLYAPVPLATETLDWQAVDEKVSPSTVLVWKRSKDASAATATAWSGYQEDRYCLGCGGLAIVRCGCRGGVVIVKRGKSTVSIKCPLCDGKGLLKCPVCKGSAIDPDLVTSTTNKQADNSPAQPRTEPDSSPRETEPESAGNPGQMRQQQVNYARKRNTSVEKQNSLGMGLVLIPPGSFRMGSSQRMVNDRKKLAEKLGIKPPNEALNDTIEEMPRHSVAISKSFLLGSTEVTVWQFRQFVDATKFETDAEKNGGNRFDFPQRKWLSNDRGTTWRTPGYDAPSNDNCPVSVVSWNDAVAFCNWLSGKENLANAYRSDGDRWTLIPGADGYRLPTEAEWEFACRAGTTTLFSCGDDTRSVEPFIWCFPHVPHAPQAVGTKRPNALGLYDMHGNVAEWCHDRFGMGYYSSSPSTDPTGPEQGNEQVVRGGDWYGMAMFCRTVKRVHFGASSAMNTRGFRVARSF